MAIKFRIHIRRPDQPSTLLIATDNSLGHYCPSNSVQSNQYNMHFGACAGRRLRPLYSEMHRRRLIAGERACIKNERRVSEYVTRNQGFSLKFHEVCDLSPAQRTCVRLSLCLCASVGGVLPLLIYMRRVRPFGIRATHDDAPIDLSKII